jgi:carbon-monoxide dehydrogenase small subunit
MTEITFTLNGKRHTCTIPEGRYMLLDLLRDQLGLTGAKLGCGVGRCGACTVVMNGEAVTSCTTLAKKADGAEITTIEGISDGFDLHPLQEAFVEHGAVQCGYCTPGFIMRLYALFTRKPDASPDEIAEVLEKNICRCTGYESIVEAANDAQQKMR